VEGRRRDDDDDDGGRFDRDYDAGLDRGTRRQECRDLVPSPHEAAIHSTANGLLAFHRSHPHCPLCGARTVMQKSGASRLCSDHRSSSGGNCHSRSIYPRIDAASIMLVTSPCGRYVLLGKGAVAGGEVLYAGGVSGGGGDDGGVLCQGDAGGERGGGG